MNMLMDLITNRIFVATAAAWLVVKGLLFRQDRQGGKPAGGTLH